ncbi:aminoacyl tRNA synthase complex-interacting multifunctional protein 1-like [Zingiber officinale]|uniref:aminoacyl tRNA synthase complex-interacting multifunctional protein 1-like n=1 Tax=Zingiber officinale TaxID=94328 RepID=UPI001C4D700C|nr:aminoacyl tRNA synthase complex-interacting multifunctional protein 1-like [Zingiber officinale]
MAAGTVSKVSDDFGMASDRNKAMAFALFKRLSLDPNKYSSGRIESSDMTSLFSNILCLSDHQVPLSNEHEIMKWVAFASSFPNDGDACLLALKHLNEELNLKSVLLDNGLKPSEADIVVFAAVHSCVIRLANTSMQKFPNVIRWMDYIQDKEDFGGVFAKIMVDKPEFIPIEIAKKKNSGDNKANGPSGKDSGANEKKKKTLEKETAEKDAESNISILSIQIGIIRKASKHPSADSLLVEEIDLGDGNLRQVVSGLAKFYSPEDLVNRRVVLVTNVKPGKLRDFMSAGLVLCASNEDHTVVEPLIPPEGALLGERVSFSGYDGKPEDVLNPKKKQLEKITPHLYTNEEGVATFKGIAFMTSAGPCKSSITKASIK